MFYGCPPALAFPPKKKTATWLKGHMKGGGMTMLSAGDRESRNERMEQGAGDSVKGTKHLYDDSVSQAAGAVLHLAKMWFARETNTWKRSHSISSIHRFKQDIGSSSYPFELTLCIHLCSVYVCSFIRPMNLLLSECLLTYLQLLIHILTIFMHGMCTANYRRNQTAPYYYWILRASYYHRPCTRTHSNRQYIYIYL